MSESTLTDERLPASELTVARLETVSRGSVLGYLALATAALLGLVAVALPTYVAHRLVKFPADIHQVTIATGTGTVLDISRLLTGTVHIDHDVPVQLSTLVTSVEPTDSDTVTLRVAQQVTRLDRSDASTLLDALVDQVSISRTSGAPARRPALTIFEPGQQPLEAVRGGLQYKFPFDTAKRDYAYFDVISQRETNLAYIDDSTVRDGLRLLHFRTEIPTTDLGGLLPMRGRVPLPATLMGREGDGMVETSLYYSAARDFWVEPATGAVVNIGEHQRRYLAASIDDPAQITVFDGTLRFDDRSADEMASQAAEARKRITALKVTGPAIAGLTATIALIIGVRRLRLSRHHHTSSNQAAGRALS